MKKKIMIPGIFCLLLCFFFQQAAFGKTFDESQAVSYETFRASHTVEDATLFIGTYLIHIQGLTDELYEKALESASDSNQMNVYYKSELASGAWMDITDANGLMDLEGEGTIVEERELDPLWVTCYTGADGITRDARDDHVINIFSDPSPYDLYSLAELEPIRIQYDNVFSPESTGVNRYYYKKLREFFLLDLQNDITQECDLQLLGLQGCYESLRADGKNELAEIVSTLMGKIDSRRRAEIFDRLSQMDGNELSVLQDICGGSEFYNYKKKNEEKDEDGNSEDDDYDEEQFVENNAVIDAIGTAIENCQESYIKHSGNMLEEGDTVLKNAEYEKSMAVIQMSVGGYGSDMEALLLELKHLYHLEEDVVADADAELQLLGGELIGKADSKYTGKLTGGASNAYQAAVANGFSLSARNQVLEDQKADTDAARLELQYLLQAKTKRQPSRDAAEFSYQRIEQAEALYGRLSGDDYQSKASESIDAHILWLKELARSLEEADDTSDSNMQKLEDKKARLLVEQAEAIDRNDLSTARKYETLLEQVDREIRAEEQELQAIISSPQSSAAEKARAANQAGSGSMLNQIDRMKDAALLDIAEGNKENQESIMQKLDALSALGAESAITEIRDKIRASGNDFKEAEKKADQAILDSRESSFHNQYGGMDQSGDGSGTQNQANNGTGAGSGTGTGTASPGNSAPGAEDLEALIEEVLGAPFEDLDDSKKAAAVAALNRIGQSGNPAAGQLARTWLDTCVREENKYVFRKLKREDKEHLPLDVIASCTGYRYVYSDSGMEVTLSKKLSVYRFCVYQDEVQLLDGVTEKLEGTVKLQDDRPYLLETDARLYFKCEAEYIGQTEYGICLGPKEEGFVKIMMEAAQEGDE